MARTVSECHRTQYKDPGNPNIFCWLVPVDSKSLVWQSDSEHTANWGIPAALRRKSSVIQTFQLAARRMSPPPDCVTNREGHQRYKTRGYLPLIGGPLASAAVTPSSLSRR